MKNNKSLSFSFFIQEALSFLSFLSFICLCQNFLPNTKNILFLGVLKQQDLDKYFQQKNQLQTQRHKRILLSAIKLFQITLLSFSLSPSFYRSTIHYFCHSFVYKEYIKETSWKKKISQVRG